MHTPILIDSFYKRYLNYSNVEIIRTEKDTECSHSYFTTLSFTQYHIPVTVITTDFTEDSLVSIFEKILFLNLENRVFMPFGSSSISSKLSNLFSKFKKEQLHCSFNNISDKNNYPSILPYVTSVASNDISRNYYYKFDPVDSMFYHRINPIKVVKQKLVFNSFILGDYYYSLYRNLSINNKKEIIMPTWNFDNHYEFEVKKDELFGYQITDDSLAIAYDLPEGVNFSDGFLYGSVDSASSFSVKLADETREFLINPSKENNYQFSILAKKW